MSDLRALSAVTGDEYSAYTLGGGRFVIRGVGNEIQVSEELAAALKAGDYGTWSGHTHPPGFSIEPSVIDRANIPFGQDRSAIWGDDGFFVFYRTPREDLMFQNSQQSELMRRFYEGR
jgi:hypothetical protein